MVDDFFKYRYGWEKFHGAVHSLSGEGTILERLENAYVFHIIHLRKENDIPIELHEQFDEVVSLMTNADAPEGRVNAAVRAMDQMTRSRVIENIISLYDSLCRYMPKH
ncbi:hypothetical protein [Pantoea phytobeneficialis]|uniref:Uncharacterized protein n=1 Tax=Pantoea phytobeneficialis TaxID=2052056 RepID=A0AAP9H470_9GAMM|nr:hypothetical protein [Pantoea phytobeneficialis]MDO6406242.1 hypothetical protein [Pantoea phytobeneficialis]QGR06261.1 hypothetical protein CTZ24_07525 [Pantoea phytobeneficialis]